MRGLNLFKKHHRVTFSVYVNLHYRSSLPSKQDGPTHASFKQGQNISQEDCADKVEQERCNLGARLRGSHPPARQGHGSQPHQRTRTLSAYAKQHAKRVMGQAALICRRTSQKKVTIFTPTLSSAPTG